MKLQSRDESKLSERFGKLLSQLREGDPRQLTVRAAAKLLRISHTRLLSLEQGKHHVTGLPTLPSPDLVERIAFAYHVPKEELMIQAGYLPWNLDLDDGKRLISFVKAEFQGC